MTTPIYPIPHPFFPHRERIVLDRIQEVGGPERYRPRLEGIRKVVEDCRSYLPKIRVAVAGTNGKGQVATEISHHLKARGISHSLFLSPHVLSVTERLSYDGENISYDILEELLEETLRRFGKMGPSFYELLFFAFIQGHARHPVDVMVTEVGLGGRFDAVNAADPTVSAIVSIGRDHTEILGEDLEQILTEKLGVARSGRPLLTALTQKSLRRFCADYCKREGIVLHDLVAKGLIDPKESYMARNARLAREVVLQIVRRDIPLAPIFSKGRGEVVGDFTFVSAHNTDGLKALVQDRDMGGFSGIVFSFSHRKREDIEEMVRTLSLGPLPLYFSKAPHFKKVRENLWPLIAKEMGGPLPGKMIDSFYPPHYHRGKDRFLVTGSNYFIGEFQKALLS
ncbi:MAG: hypothetical protein OXB88_06275 [Bacteriovoracales bacterium]|nr:hypothetical protein [Bacteriovoracales bacterium]